MNHYWIHLTLKIKNKKIKDAFCKHCVIIILNLYIFVHLKKLNVQTLYMLIAFYSKNQIKFWKLKIEWLVFF